MKKDLGIEFLGTLINKGIYVPSNKDYGSEVAKFVNPEKHLIEAKEKMSRNEKCFCGSGKKYKKCCMNKKEESKVVYVTENEYRALKLRWEGGHIPSKIAEKCNISLGRYYELIDMILVEDIIVKSRG